MSKIQTTIKIKVSQSAENGLYRLFDSIFDWVATMHPDIEELENAKVGRYYLKSIALHSGVLPDVSKVETLGFINSWSISPARHELEIKQTTFQWKLCVAMWELIAKRYVPDAIVEYKSICKSSNDYSTNIPAYIDKYVIETKESYVETASREETESILSKRYKGSFEDMYATYKNKRPMCLNIARWDFVPIAETI